MVDARILCSVRRALGAAALIAMLAACGQRGPLYLPTEAAAADRATLPQVLLPTTRTQPAPPLDGQVAPGGSGTGTAAPVRTQ
ncbi:LPS translocon maturation chaperone LptM [Ramlibacter algicola]|jgi:predicted small lipoprotein YifL|uniref:Lipoprotein n=1 Tax=Ramlibacter algicola TaxID=2795217 RepID=A0A934USV9_9BURK|nr:lipoprotein [Ramlibacter algicola]MBK0394675.1 lipoprotein [Ramlibacter algicola]